MDFSIETTATGGSDLTWLASSHGQDAGQPGTLNLTSLASAINTFGIIPSGVAVGKITATGQYGLYTSGASNGTEVLAGYVLSDVNARNLANVTNPSGKAAFALLYHGAIKRSRLPLVAQRTAITHTTVSTGQFSYVD